MLGSKRMLPTSYVLEDVRKPTPSMSRAAGWIVGICWLRGVDNLVFPSTDLYPLPSWGVLCNPAAAVSAAGGLSILRSWIFLFQVKELYLYGEEDSQRATQIQGLLLPHLSFVLHIASIAIQVQAMHQYYGLS